MAKEYLVPNGLDADNANYVLTGAPSKPEAVDDPHGAVSTAEFLTCSTNGQEIRFTFSNTSANIGNGTVINYITVRHTSGPEAITYIGQTWRAFVRSGGVFDYEDWRTATGYRNWEHTFPKDPSGNPWTKTSLDAITGGWGLSTPGGDGSHFAAIEIEIDYVADPAKIGAARGVGSRQLRLRRRPLRIISLKGPLAWADVELLQPAWITHPALPTTADAGAGVKKWERVYAIKLSSEIDLDAPDLAERSTWLDMRDLMVYDWDPMISEEPPGTTAPGIPRLTNGGGRLFTRGSEAWIENAAAAKQGLKRVVKIPADVSKNTADGELIEGAAKNYIPRSSMADGLTGLTAVGASGQTTLDSADRLFDDYDSLKITRNATAEDQGRTWPASDAFAANDVATLSIDYKNDSGVALYAYAQRSTDSKYLRQSDWTWQTGIQYITLPVVASLIAGTEQRFRTPPVVIDTTGTPTVTVSVVHKSADANGTISHVYHVQLEKNRFATSRMVSGVASFTRAFDHLRLENNAGKRIWPHLQGTTFIEFEPNWNSADLVTANPDLLKAHFDANNFERLFYNITPGAFTFRRRVAGVNYSATFNVAVTRGTTYKIAIRRTGVEGELGLAPHTLSIFVNGAKGTDAVAVPFGALPSDPLYLYVGQDDINLQHAEGFLRFRESTPFVRTDEEIAGEHAA